MRHRVRAAAATLVVVVVLALAGIVVSATPALAWTCRVVTADNMRTFSSYSGSTTVSPHLIYQGQRVRVFEVRNGRYRVNFEWQQNPRAGTYYGRWISANDAYTNPYGGACTHSY